MSELNIFKEKRTSPLSIEQQDIEILIQQENDPQVRLQLMIMNRINLSLIANTTTIDEIGKRLEEHLTNYEQRTKNEDEIINKGRGAWKVAAWIFTVLQIGIVYAWNDMSTAMQNINKVSQDHSLKCAEREQRIKTLESNSHTHISSSSVPHYFSNPAANTPAITSK